MPFLLSKIKSISTLFVAMVVFPTTLAIVYFAFLASDVYISESRFVVRSAGKSSVSPLGTLLSTGVLSSAGEDNYTVVDYVRSREALRESNRDGFVQQIYSGSKGSFLDRFDSPFSNHTREHLYYYYGGKVDIEYDTSTQVTNLTVRAFSPQDAQKLNERLLGLAEQLVNRLSERGRRDAIASAEAQVDSAREKARNATVALARYRNASGVIDPEKQAAINLQMISKLQDLLIADQTQLTQIQDYTPNNPQIPAIKTRIASITREIERQSSMVAGAPKSLSSTAQQFQQLLFDQDFANKQLAVALASLQEAENEARKKQIYIERIAVPDLPDYPLEPRRLRGIAATLALSLLAWGVATTLLAGIREHRD